VNSPAHRVRHRLPPARWPTREDAARARWFSPIRIGRQLTAAERTWVPAMVPWRATGDGFVTPEVLDWYARFARGQPGVLVVEATGIRDVRSGPLLRIGDDRFIPGLRALVDLAVLHLPGGGLLRDAEKLVAPLALVEAVGFGVGAEWLLSALAGRRTRAALAAVLVAAPVLLLPALAWGAAGRLQPVAYPREWAAAREVMAADPVPGAMLVLPWHLYLAFPWNGNRTVLDPAQRYFTRRAVGNDDLELAGVTVPGEDPYGARLAPLVTGPAPFAPGLGAAGIRYVLAFKLAGVERFTPRLAGLAMVLDNPELSLYRVPDPAVAHLPGASGRGPVLLADALALATLAWAVTGLAMAGRRRKLVSSRRSGEGSR